MCTRALVWLFITLYFDGAYALSNASPSKHSVRQAKPIYAPSVHIQRLSKHRSRRSAVASPKTTPSRGLKRRSLEMNAKPPSRRFSCKERKDQFQEAYNATAIPEKDDPCRNGMENCVVSIAVYCRKSRCDDYYTRGIKNNIKAMRKIFPGWKLRIYTDGSLPRNLSDSIKSDISEEVVVKGVQGKIAGMFWRFFAANDPTVDRVSIRDSDNIPSLREKALVNEWIRSGKKYHAIRDHPSHHVPLMGGLWGVMKKRDEAVAIPKSVIEDRAHQGELNKYFWYRSGDQDFLLEHVWQLAVPDLIAHDSYLCNLYPQGLRHIPVPRRGGRDIVGYPNDYKDEDEFYECDKPVETVYANMQNNLDHQRAPRQCLPQDHLDWEYN